MYVNKHGTSAVDLLVVRYWYFYRMPLELSAETCPFVFLFEPHLVRLELYWSLHL